MKNPSRSSDCLPASRRGVSLIEVVAVLVVLGVLAAMAMGRMAGSDNAVSVEKDRLAAHLRFVQLRAMADIHPWRLEFTDGGRSYEIGIDGDPVTIVNLPGETAPRRTLSEKVRVAGTPVVIFDSWGRPVDSAGSPLTENQVVEFEGHDAPLVIHARTGFIR